MEGGTGDESWMESSNRSYIEKMREEVTSKKNVHDLTRQLKVMETKTILEWILEDEMWFSKAFDNLVIAFLEDASASLHTRRVQNNREITGAQCVNNILSGDPNRCYDIFRMSMANFHVLCQRISNKLNTSMATVPEQLAIFLLCIGHGYNLRVIGEYFQHSFESMYRLFKDVLKAILGLHNEYIKQPDSDTNSRNHFFKDALGAIDGMHIPALVNKNIERFCNKKGTLSQNVLAACSFDMIFLYVVVGWEGSASDMRVLNWAIKDGGFTVPNGRYYLADSGFANTPNFLTPYRNHPYHVVKFNCQTRVSRYAVPEALYNHRHAQVRNVIERTFGVLKMRFKILERMPSSLGFRKQTLVVMACCIIHNFIKMQNTPDRFFDASVNMEFTHDNAESVDSRELPSATDIAAGDVIQDNVKNALWRQSTEKLDLLDNVTYVVT